MNALAQNLLFIPQDRSEDKYMENTMNYAVDFSTPVPLYDNMSLSNMVTETAQATLSDLDRSIMELAALVENLRINSKKMNIQAL